MSYFCSLYSILKKVKLFEQRNIVIYSIFTVIYFFIFVPQILPQVKIEESVVITPQSVSAKFVNSVSSSSHIIKLVGEWEQTMLGADEDIPMNRQRFKVSTSCGNDIYSPSDYSGYTEFSFSAEYGATYNIQFLNAQRTLWDPSYRYEGAYGGRFDVFIDGQLYESAINYISITPWFGSLGFQIYGGNINHGGSLNINVVKVESCDPIIGSMNDDWPEISIISGGEYLSFYDEESDDTLGNSFYLGDFISNIPKLIYDSPYYKDGELDGILQAELNGTFAFDTVGINKADDFELIVDIEPEELDPGESADIHLLQDLGFTEEEFSEGQLFNVEIIDGSQYGTIVAQNGTDTSDIFNNIPQGFTFRANENITDSVEVYIKVSTLLEGGVIIVSRDNLDKSEMNKSMTTRKSDAVNPDVSSNNLSVNNLNWIIIPPEENREIYGIAGVKIIDKDSLDHFELCIKPDSLAIKDTIAFTESAKLYVTAKDADSNSIEIDTSKMLSFEITSMNEYGTFISSSGDTLNSSQTVLSNISYGKAKTGKVRFAALFENPDSIVSCNIKVTLQDDTSKCGEREAVVLEQTLKIVMEEPYAVWPTYFNRSGERVTHEDSSKKGFNIFCSRGQKSQANHRIILTKEFLDSSGAHYHLNRLENEENRGYFKKNNDSLIYHTIIDTTNSFGVIENITYFASMFGDTINIKVKSSQNNFLVDSIKLVEMVPNLMVLPNSDNYIKYGGTTTHLGPPIDETHDFNHYGTEELITAIQNIAIQFHIDYPNLRIRINDMSLPLGGGFDIYGNWISDIENRDSENRLCVLSGHGHCTHRLGINADISYRGLDNTGNIVNFNQEQRRTLHSYISQYYGQPYTHSGANGHFHLQ